MLDEKDLIILEELLNEEILEHLKSGYGLTNGCVVRLRAILRKLNLKEIYNFDKRFKENR